MNPNCKIGSIVLTRPNVPPGNSIAFPKMTRQGLAYDRFVLVGSSWDGMKMRYELVRNGTSD